MGLVCGKLSLSQKKRFLLSSDCPRIFGDFCSQLQLKVNWFQSGLYLTAILRELTGTLTSTLPFSSSTYTFPFQGGS